MIKNLFALIITTLAVNAAKAQVTHSDTTGTEVGSYSEILTIPKSHGNKVLTDVNLRFDSWTSAHGGGITDTILVSLTITGLSETWVDYDYTVPVDADNWNVTSGISAGFSTVDQPPGFNAMFTGSGHIAFAVNVSITDSFGVPEDGETQVTVIYTYSL